MLTLHDYAWKPGINPVVTVEIQSEKFPGLFGTDPMYTEVIPSVWEVVYIQQLGQLYFIIACSLMVGLCIAIVVPQTL